MTYRQLPLIANSDLTEFKNWLLFGIPPVRKESAALNFGIIFHHYLLIDTGHYPTGKGTRPLHRMLNVLRSDARFTSRLVKAQVEQPVFWKDPKTGLFCKAQLDLLIEADRLIVDTKTTGAKSEEEFRMDCLRFGYDRQAAFYVDGCRASGRPVDRFLIMGIQKQKPHAIFIVEESCQSDFVEAGRKKYRRLLRSWFERPFTPSSWQTQLPINMVVTE
jgi:hypothetical protein